MTVSIIKSGYGTKRTRNGKNVVKLVRLSILRPLMFKCEILWQYESLTNLKDLYAGWESLPSGDSCSNLLNAFKPTFRHINGL